MSFAKALIAAATMVLVAAPTARAVHGINLKDAMKTVETTKYIFESGLFNAIFAKEICSCLYVDKQTMADCKANDNLPSIAHSVVTVTASVAYDDPDTTKVRTVTSKFNLAAKTVAGALIKLGPPASARYVGPEFGCVMTSPAPAEH